MHELEQAEVERQLVLRDAAVRSQPGAQQRPEAFHRVDMHLAEAVPVRVDKGARGNSGGDDRLDRGLLHVGQHAQDHLAATLDQAEDGRLVLLQRAAARHACQPAAPSEPPLLATAAGCPLCPATT